MKEKIDIVLNLVVFSILLVCCTMIGNAVWFWLLDRAMSPKVLAKNRKKNLSKLHQQIEDAKR